MTVDPLAVLAQGDENGSVFVWAIILLVFVLLLAGAFAFFRKRLSPTEDFHAEGFTLSDLRRLHKSGKMTDDEYERAKEVLVSALAKPAPPPNRQDPTSTL